jgi:hypothetical protein
MNRRQWFRASAGAGSLAVIPIVGFGNHRAASHVFVVKPTACMCCDGWADQLRKDGFSVTITEIDDISAVKDRLHVPDDLRACHTGMVEGYVIEGHVPPAYIKKLLTQSPKVTGIALPEGAPTGAPFKITAFSDKDRNEFRL